MIDVSTPTCETVDMSSTERGGRGKPVSGFGERLRVSRDKAGLTQAQVAETLGVSWQTISNWETGQRVPGAEDLFRLSELYGESPVFLLRGVRPKTLAEHPLGGELATRVAGLSPERQQEVLRAFIALLEQEGQGGDTARRR